jgi:hypothetical protein
VWRECFFFFFGAKMTENFMGNEVDGLCSKVSNRGWKVVRRGNVEVMNNENDILNLRNSHFQQR